MPASFDDQIAILDELLHEVERMEAGEKRMPPATPPADSYEAELRLAGLAQRIAQAYTIIEGVLAFVARRIDRKPVTGDDWHKRLISLCSQPRDDPKRPAVVSAALAEDLLELCEFRHVVRNIYPTRLAAPKVHENLLRLIRAARIFRGEATAFAVALAPTRRKKSKARKRRV